MASLPSYQEAVGRSDWLELVAPHASVADLPSLCLVSKRFYDRFSCRLWADPLRAARLLGLDPAEGSLINPFPTRFLWTLRC